MNEETTTELPADDKLEQNVLGAILLEFLDGERLEPSAFERATRLLDADSFFFEAHRRIWSAMGKLYEGREPVELMLVAAELQKRGQLEDLGGEEYLRAIASGALTAVHVEQYALRLRDLHNRRRLIQQAADLDRRARKPSADPAEIAALGMNTLQQIHQGSVAAYRPPRRTSWTGTELAAAEFPEPNWVLPDMIPHGLTFLGGRPKAGKSIFALQLAFAVAVGGCCLGRDCKQGRVLLLSLEDQDRRVHDRTGPQKQAWTAPALENSQFELEWPVAGAGGLDALRDALTETDYALCIIDTFTRFAGGSIDQDKVGEVSDLLAVLQATALDTDTAVMVIDHFNKLQADDPVDAMLGSTAKAAIPDTIIGLYKRAGTTPLLRGRGRDVEEFEVPIQFDARLFCWQPTADQHGVVTGSVQDDIVEAIRDLGGTSYLTEIATELDQDAGFVRRQLVELVNKGALVKLSKEGKRQPYALPSSTLL